MSNIISPEACIALAADSSVCLVDCRFELSDVHKGKSLYYESHIPGAVYLALDEDLSAPPRVHGGRHPLPPVEYMGLLFGKLGIERNKTRVIAYDDSGGPFAARLWWMLRYCGHETAQVLDGGFSGYVYAGGNLTNELPLYIPVEFIPDVQSGMLAGMNDVRNLPPDSMLIDCRAKERYRGENETIDKKAGHIPGAFNLHWMGNLDAQNRLLPAGSLQDRFAAFNNNPVMYCGSGVTACVNVLAYEEAGLGMARLYPGSWSDWISYPENETASGG